MVEMLTLDGAPVPAETPFPRDELPFENCTQMLESDAAAGDPIWKLAIRYEAARARISEPAVMKRALDLVGILRKSLSDGLDGTDYDDRLLGVQSKRFARLMKEGAMLDAGILNRITLYVTALMEVKSAMGLIVAMPTAGACAALPGALLGTADEMSLVDEDVAHALLAAGLIGAFISNQWTFAAEAGGCQAECGAASAMAAGGLVVLADGTLNQVVTGASLALQNTLGLICDPIANRVEAPCLGRNVMAASNALTCANMALAGYDALIPLDEVIMAARSVGEQLPRELRCTALGGLSTTPTARKLEKKLSPGAS
jgi:L-serine dehydratase